MLRFLIRRLFLMIITLFLTMSFTFFLMKFLPGTPFNNAEKLTQFQLKIMEDKYGLGDPVPVQYVKYMGNLIKADLGISFQFDNIPVSELISDRIGPSALLGFQAMVLGSLAGMALGILAAVRRNTWLDYGSTLFAVIGISVPSFIFAGLLQYYVAVKLDLLPVMLWKGPEYTILPTLALSVFPISITARFMRTEMIEVLNSDFITLAKAKGLSQFEIITKHAIRNAMIPVVTVLGPLAVSLMTGTLVIEQIFSVPGLGEQFVRSISVNDYSVIMGTTLLFSFLFILVIIIVDILYILLDPRIRIK